MYGYLQHLAKNRCEFATIHVHLRCGGLVSGPWVSNRGRVEHIRDLWVANQYTETMTLSSRPSAIFAGLSTFDVIHQVKHLPQSNQKTFCDRDDYAAGGPATNAAVTYSALMNVYCKAKNREPGKTQLWTRLGRGAMADFARQDIAHHGIHIVDAAHGDANILPTALILVEEETGNRAVSSKAVRTWGSASFGKTDDELSAAAQTFHNFEALQPEIVLVDGHHVDIATAALSCAQSHAAPKAVILDGGSYKAGLEQLLPHVTMAICSDNFMPPGCDSNKEVVDYFAEYGVTKVVRTRGDKDILYWWDGEYGSIPVEPTAVVCTLGAGDVFHGAFAFWLAVEDFPTDIGQIRQGLQWASRIVALSLTELGAHQWIVTCVEDIVKLIDSLGRRSDKEQTQ